MMKLFAVLLLLLVASQSSPQSPRGPDVEQSRILTLESAWNQAVQQKDAEALNMLLAPDFTYVEYDGSLMNRAQYLASVEAPSVHPVRIVNDSMDVHLYGSVAVVNGLCRESGVKNGKAYALRERFTDTWILRSSNWMCVASQSTPLPR